MRFSIRPYWLVQLTVEVQLRTMQELSLHHASQHKTFNNVARWTESSIAIPPNSVIRSTTGVRSSFSLRPILHAADQMHSNLALAAASISVDALLPLN